MRFRSYRRLRWPDRDSDNAIEALTRVGGPTLRAVIAESLFCQQVSARLDLRQKLCGVGRPLHWTTSAAGSLESLFLGKLVRDAAGPACTVAKFSSILWTVWIAQHVAA